MPVDLGDAFSSSYPESSLLTQSRRKTFARSKRKMFAEDGRMIPCKRRITDQIMTQLNDFHLSSAYTSHGSSATESSSGSENEVIKESLPDVTQSMYNFQTVELSEEIKNLTCRKLDPVIPPTFIDKFCKPSNALVLWQPPICPIINSVSSIPSSSEDEIENAPTEAPSPAPPDVVDVEMVEDDDNNNNSNMNGF